MVIVAVSVDAKKALVPPAVERFGWTFQVLLSDGLVEEAYDTATLPQTYVIDGEGRVRFHRTGFQTRHFAETLDWMIEAAAVER